MHQRCYGLGLYDDFRHASAIEDQDATHDGG
jgi:hypothetical protein